MSLNISLRHLLSIGDLTKSEFECIIKTAIELKAEHRQKKKHSKLLTNKTLAMVFESHSTRTRISFEVAMNHLDGNAIVLPYGDSQLARGESISDSAKVLSRYCDAILVRTKNHETLIEFAKYSSIPIINGLSDKEHPCQVLADIMTIQEEFGSVKNKVICWIGDCNNVFFSLVKASEICDFEIRIACPESIIQINKDYLIKQGVKASSNTETMVRGADVVMTDVWLSMHHSESEQDERKKLFSPFKVTKQIMKFANKNAIFLHCLPAKRDQEVEGDVIDGPTSRVWDEAENRLHVQKSLLLKLMNF
ncbi:MAG: ornithine carbamoyltransferase [Methylacidiphilales bacterium]|nr:ornithine carbamoyltransferase [Candidatus Methylacidiphilales bacterium]